MSWSKYICLEALFWYKRFALDTQSYRNTPEVDPAFVLMASSSSSTSISTSTSTSKFDLPGPRNVPSFSPNGDGGHFSNLEKSDFFFIILWIGLFTVEEKFSMNRKISHFSFFFWFRTFTISGPVSLPIFRPNGEGGNYSNKIRWIGIFSEAEKFPINRKIFHFTNFKKMVAKNGGEQKAVGNKKRVRKI